MRYDDSTNKPPAPGQVSSIRRHAPNAIAAGPAPPGTHDRRAPKREMRRPRRYVVTIRGEVPANLADGVAGLHAAAIRGRDDASEPSAGLVGPDDSPSGAVRRTPAPHG